MSVLLIPRIGDLFLITDTRNTTPGVEQTLINHSLTFGVEISQIQVNCNMEADFSVFLDAKFIGSGRTGPGDRNADHDLKKAGEKAISGQIITVKFTANIQTAIVAVDSFVSTIKT